MAVGDICKDLRTCELFDSLDEGEVQVITGLLGDSCRKESYQAGNHVFDQGEISSNLYVIVSGQVVLQRTVNLGGKTATRPLGLLSKGRAMGWSALLYGPRYTTASAVCRQPSELIAIEGARLRAALEKEPVIGFKVMDRLACLLGDRLRAAYNTMEGHL
ncbi:MAG: cyclic nucleotide-binding domain-containing protein [Dehalococcoidales bacterium]|nr:MAG: cyclic nucleotide-binding domain-containing protein [Dehalococcoidales bacterium]